MGDSAGQIAIDLVMNQGRFESQLRSITGVVKKAGAALVAAFSVKKIIDFGKDCLELGSDLEEVQNVVDVTFTHMSERVNTFAQSAAFSYGLSETMAKRFTGTFGAMAKSFGFSEEAAYEMSTTLTGLSGDVASFYNISQDEAYTKLKSVFTGETETLKDLGIVMTQSALDAYALANGYGKTTEKMTEMERVALRYAFVQDQLSLASGDFARTSDSWANQVRILSLQFDSLKASIGQGLINLFTPIIKGINAVVGKLVILANAFKSFTELITGKKASSGMSDMAGNAEEGFSGAAGAADDLADGAAGAGKAAKKAAKEMRVLMGFDQIQKMDKPASDSSGGSGGKGGTGATSGGSMDFGNLAQGDTVITKIDQSLAGLIERVKKLAGLFRKGFRIGFGDSEKNITKIKKSLQSIWQSLKEIFTSKEVIDAAGEWADSVSFNLGKASGAVASVGVAIVTNLTGGIAKSLEEKKTYIKEKLASLFHISAEIWNVSGDFVAALGEIISKALTCNAAIDISSDICSILITGVLGGAELFAKAALDISQYLLKPIIDNKDKISEAIENTLKPLSDVVDTIKTAVEDVFSILNKAYDEHISPMFQTLTEGVSDTFGKFLDAYNTYIAPVLSNLASKFREVYEQHMKPCLEKIGDLIGTVADMVAVLYLTWIKPFVDWCVKTIIPVLAPVFECIGETILAAWGSICDTVGGVIQVFDGIITFLIGAFTWDWQKGWEGIKKIFSGVKNWMDGVLQGIRGILQAFLKLVKKIAKSIANWILKKCSEIWKEIKNVFKGIGTWFGERKDAILAAFHNLPEGLKKKFKDAWEKIKAVFGNLKGWFVKKKDAVVSAFSSLPSKLREKFSEAWEKIKAVFGNLKGWFVKKKDAAVAAFNGLPADLESKFSDAWGKIKDVFSEVGQFFEGVWGTIKTKFTDIGTKIGDAIGGAFKSVINGVLTTVENTLNKGIGFINSAIDAINKLPGVNVSKMKDIDLPRLAQGGYVKKNTPQLAMIGDNRHQGEIVAPEDKLSAMAQQAAKMAGGSRGNAEIVSLLTKLISLIEDSGDIVMRVDAQELARANQRGSLKLKRKYATTRLVFE